MYELSLNELNFVSGAGSSTCGNDDYDDKSQYESKGGVSEHSCNWRDFSKVVFAGAAGGAAWGAIRGGLLGAPAGGVGAGPGAVGGAVVGGISGAISGGVGYGAVCWW